MDECDICGEPYGSVQCVLCANYICGDCCENEDIGVVCYVCLDEYHNYENSKELFTCPNCLKKELYELFYEFRCWNCKIKIKKQVYKRDK